MHIRFLGDGDSKWLVIDVIVVVATVICVIYLFTYFHTDRKPLSFCMIQNIYLS